MTAAKKKATKKKASSKKKVTKKATKKKAAKKTARKKATKKKTAKKKKTAVKKKTTAPASTPTPTLLQAEPRGAIPDKQVQLVPFELALAPEGAAWVHHDGLVRGVGVNRELTLSYAPVPVPSSSAVVICAAVTAEHPGASVRLRLLWGNREGNPYAMSSPEIADAQREPVARFELPAAQVAGLLPVALHVAPTGGKRVIVRSVWAEVPVH